MTDTDPLTIGLRIHMHKKRSCNCKNSRCTKLYCECFAAGVYCNETCNCVNCCNNKVCLPRRWMQANGVSCAVIVAMTQENEAIRAEAIEATLERNPAAFRPKIASGYVVAACWRLLLDAHARLCDRPVVSRSTTRAATAAR